MSSVQLNFTLRVSSRSCKSVNLVGSWDNYRQHLPLTRESGSKHSFKGQFRFAASSLPAGSYWYYYIVDGHSVTYDPTQPNVVERTTGRTLNLLQVDPRHGGDTTRDMRPSGRYSRVVPNGRSLSPSQIQHPFPSRPYETKAFSSREMEALSRRYAAQRLADSDTASSDDDSSVGYSSGNGSDVPSLSSRSSNNSSPSSMSSLSSGSSCSCERYAITRNGQRIKLDCGGKVCQGSDEGSCSSSSSSDSEQERYASRRGHSSRKHSSSSGNSRRHGLVVRR